jgi:hypothetical protein
MKKLIIHIDKNCKASQQDQCQAAVWQLSYYFDHKGDNDTRITAYWSRQGNSDVLIMCHDKSDTCVFTWEDKC